MGVDQPQSNKKPTEETQSTAEILTAFKKPVLVGKVGRLPRKITKQECAEPKPPEDPNNVAENVSENSECNDSEEDAPNSELNIGLSYSFLSFVCFRQQCRTNCYPVYTPSHSQFAI